MILGTNCRFPETNCRIFDIKTGFLYLGKQDFGGERPVLAVAADIAAEALHDGVYPDQAEAVSLPLGAAEPLSLFPAVKLVKEM